MKWRSKRRWRPLLEAIVQHAKKTIEALTVRIQYHAIKGDEEMELFGTETGIQLRRLLIRVLIFFSLRSSAFSSENN